MEIPRIVTVVIDGQPVVVDLLANGVDIPTGYSTTPYDTGPYGG